ncbi:MAG: hypothetical protein JXX29_12380 [Deltaproteobacteria bacterium]|nr:hypothetical protein [Deltaproteobacteria bacterium]MBN2672471.1 hypothetical protein [Deltaproteobacteria bacterium]
MTTISQLQQKYMDVEREIASLWPKSFARICAACADICCRPHMADEVLDSDWLNAISQQAHGKWWRAARFSECRALGSNGCMLQHGKPPFCYSFYCDRLLECDNPHELVANLFLSNILTALCKMEKGLNLAELAVDEWEKHRLEISARISQAETHVGLVKQFHMASGAEQAAIAFRMLVEMPGLLTASVRRALLGAL